MFQKDKFWEKQKIYLWETWIIYCYDFNWFRLYSHDQRQSIAKDVRFQRLKRMPWVLIQGIVLGSS